MMAKICIRKLDALQWKNVRLGFVFFGLR